MSSASKHRSVLSPKPINRSTSASPFKAESPFAISQKRSNAPYLIKKAQSPKKSAGFIIFEDPVRYVAPNNENDDAGVSGNNMNNNKENFEEELSNKQNHNDQENILQPSKKAGVSPLKLSISSGSLHRKPLAQLNISEHPGYIATSNGRSSQLSESWVPPNYNNEQKSLHKFQTRIPSFITPPRNLKYIRLDSVLRDFASTSLSEKYLFKTNVFEENEEDEIERSLQWREMEIKRKRSNSVGKNQSKLKLIRKNSFEILSN